MIKLSKKHIQKLKEIFSRVYGAELTDDEAAMAAERLIEVLVLIVKSNDSST